MNTSRSYFRTVLWLVMPSLVGGCQCIRVPANDAIPPVATLNVTFDDPAGNSVVRYVNTTDHTAPVAVQVPAGRPFTIACAGDDDGGIRSLLLDYTIHERHSNGTSSQSNVAIPLGDFSQCAKTYRLVSKNFTWGPDQTRFDFTTTARDFHNNPATTARIVISKGP